jgi:hypothetical protein
VDSKSEQFPIQADRPNWPTQLKRLGIANLAAALLEAGRPLAPILAQLLYIADPIFPSGDGRKTLSALGARLEENEEISAMIQDLHSEAK